MATETLPSIRVTDPQSRDGAPSLPQSPYNQEEPGAWDGQFRRPAAPASRQETQGKNSRPSSSGQSVSPNRSRRPRPDSAAKLANGQGTDGISRHDSLPAIDPLSQHIMDRTNTGLTASAPRATSPGAELTPERSPSLESTSIGSQVRVDSGTKPVKGEKKGVSFFSRIIGGKKKEHSEHIPDDVSEVSENRPEGANAQVFAQNVDGIEYNPSQPQPPAYIKVRARNRKRKDFDRLFLAQELQSDHQATEGMSPTKLNARRRSSATSRSTGGSKTIWSVEFSKDGKFLATAGHDKIVRVWQVIANPESRHAEERRDSSSTFGSVQQHVTLSAQVFHRKPIREYRGHESTILDLSWSKNNFLLSSSMDKTVRLWHVSRPECLCTFKHNDFVPSISFHPKDDRFFLAGSLDRKLRLWSIPDKHVAYWVQAPDMITAVAFTPDGKHAMAGCLNGMCTFYETEGLKYQTQIHVRSTHGKNARGSKITGIQTIQTPPHSSTGDVKILISSNDSRVRMYNFRDKSLEIKFKGCVNSSSQIRASITDDHKYVCCGSEDNRAYIWPVTTDAIERRDKRPIEHFQAHGTVVTCVSFAPTKTRQVLAKSEDPIYAVCNPPPVTLVSRAEHEGSINSSRPASVHTNGQPRQSTDQRRPEESATQLARSTHKAGHIIVTADYSGLIKVFRQDCAHSKRHRQDTWESSSGFMKRVNSMRTKGSNRSLRSGRESFSTQNGNGSDRILSWRQGIASTPSMRNGSISSKHRGRSVSPGKSTRQLSVRSKDARIATPNTDSFASSAATLPQVPSPTIPEGRTPEDFGLHATESNPLMMIGEQSNLFWDVDSKKRDAEERKREYEAKQAEHDRLSLPEVRRQGSYVSQLSIDRSELSESSAGESEYEDAEDRRK